MRSAGLRWLLVPWRDLTLVVALIGAAAAPVFLVATAGLWRAGAADEISQLLISTGPDSDRLLTVETNAFFTQEGTAAADQAVTARLADIEVAEPAIRTLSTPRGLVANGRDGAPLPTPVRLVNHDTAIQTIDYVRHLPDEFEGAWISGWLAEKYDLQLGDTLVYFSDAEPEQPGAEMAPGGGGTAEILVVGIYEQLWTEEGGVPASDRGVDLDAFVDTLPPELVPSYVSPFQAPGFSLVFVDDAVMADAQVSGTARWAAPISTPPATLSELTSLVGEVRQLERAIARDVALTSGLEAQAAIRPASPTVVSTLPQTLSRVRQRVATLNQPLLSGQIAGASIGLLVMVSAAAFAVARRRNEFALLASEGDRWEQFAGRAFLQLLLPTVAGTAVGLGLAALAGATVGPSADSLAFAAAFSSLDVARSAAVALGGLVLASVASGLLGERVLVTEALGAPTMRRRLAVLAVGVALTAFVWADVGGERQETGAVDLSLIGLPVLALATAVAIGLFAIERAAGSIADVLSRHSAVGFLAWRRATRADSSSRVVVAALGVALGLLGISTVMVAELEDASSAALATEIGSETLVDLVGRPSDDTPLPARSTVIGFDETRVSPGNRQVRVIAVDTSSAADALTWPTDAPLSFDEVTTLLGSEIGSDLPVVAVSGQSLPTTGSFGLSERFPYQVVGEVDTLPLASGSRATLLVSVDRLDQFALDRATAVQGGAVADTFFPPSRSLRQNLVSAQPTQLIEPFLDDNDVRFRSITSRAERRAEADYVVPAFAFGYLRWLGAVSAFIAAASLLLYLSSQRATRELGALMMRRMGMTPRRLALVTAVEVVTLVTIAITAAALVSPLIIRRTLPRFDPAPALPPSIELSTPWLGIGAVALCVLTITGGVVWLAERITGLRADAVVLREHA